MSEQVPMPKQIRVQHVTPVSDTDEVQLTIPRGLALDAVSHTTWGPSMFVIIVDLTKLAEPSGV